MKTLKQNITKKQNAIVALAVLVFTLISFSAVADDSPYRKKRFKTRKARMSKNLMKANFSTSFLNSASGHKSSYTANFGMGNSRNVIEAGVLLNRETNQLSGGQLRYKRFILPSNRNTSLYMQASAIYRNNSPLKNKLNRVMYEDDFSGEYGTYNTVELYAGFGFQQRFMKNFFTDFSIGLGGYNRHLNNSDFRHKSYIRYSADQGVGVNIKLTVGYYLW